jgi:hypothetical protein
LTDEEIIRLDRDMPVATGKILKNQAAWEAYAEVAESAVRSWREWAERVFKAGKK